MPQTVAEEYVEGDRNCNNHGDCQAEMDKEEVLEELGIGSDDTKVKEYLGPRSPPGVSLFEEGESVENT